MDITFQEVIDFFKSILSFKITLNETDITFLTILSFILILVGFLIFSKLFTKILFNRILSRFQIEQGLRFTLKRLTHYFIMIIGSIVAFHSLGINLSSLAIIFGFLSVGIGFGLQNITSNFVAGLILLFERPIKVGDRISVGDTEGDVSSINMRSTTVRSLNNISIIVPNSEFISSKVVNWSHGDTKVRMDVEIGVSYESDLDIVLSTLMEIAKENNRVLKKPKSEVILKSFGDSAWNLELRIWIKNPKYYYQIMSEINCEIVRKFRKNNIEIPFPQRDLHVRSPLPVPILERSETRN